jgi:hypothetical protein
MNFDVYRDNTFLGKVEWDTKNCTNHKVFFSEDISSKHRVEILERLMFVEDRFLLRVTKSFALSHYPQWNRLKKVIYRSSQRKSELIRLLRIEKSEDTLKEA